jgi:hypothetical protein
LTTLVAPEVPDLRKQGWGRGGGGAVEAGRGGIGPGVWRHQGEGSVCSVSSVWRRVDWVHVYDWLVGPNTFAVRPGSRRMTKCRAPWI